MKFLYVLTLVLFFYGGIIRQCEGAGGSEHPSTSLQKNLQNLPKNVYEEILFRCGFSTTKQAAKDIQRSFEAAKKIFEDRIIEIRTRSSDPQTQAIIEETLDGDNYLIINGGQKGLSVFSTFGDYIKKIKLNVFEGNDIRRQINENIIKKYAKQFTQLRIVSDLSFSEFLNELSNSGKQIHFPNVTKLVYGGPDFGDSYDLNSIFPQLQDLNLYYYDTHSHYSSPMRINTNCMKNIRNLKELKLEINPNSYKLNELENILARNTRMSTLMIVLGDNINILRSIEVHLKTVKTLEIKLEDTRFMNHLSNDTTFNMPALKRVNLRGYCITDHRLIYLINSFKKLETLDMGFVLNNCYVMQSMDSLIEIHELITFLPIISIREMLDGFGKKKNLNIVRLSSRHESDFSDHFKSELIRTNRALTKSPWKIDFLKPKGCNYGLLTLTRSLSI